MVLAPSIMDYVRDAQWVKVKEDCEAIGVSVARLTRDVKVGWRYTIYNRFAAPLTCLVITLFAIPAGVATGRQSVFLGVVMAVALFFLYYALTLVLGIMAKKDLIPVGVGVLLPHIVFLAAGLVLFHRQR